MILADTSVWIDFFAGRQTTQVDVLKQALVARQVLIGDLILIELLQGPRHQRDVMRLERAFAGLPVELLCGSVIAPIAAANYRRLGRSGFAPRGAVDVIIATWCIQCAIPLLHNDRDFLVMERELGLATASHAQ